MMAAFGIVQLTKFEAYAAARWEISKQIRSALNVFEEFIQCQEPQTSTRVSWLSFPILLRAQLPFGRRLLQAHLETRRIQTRTVLAGNVLRQPAYRHMAKGSESVQFTVADAVMKNGLMVGCHQKMDENDVAYLADSIQTFLDDNLRQKKH